jgi:hypothetical protein
MLQGAPRKYRWTGSGSKDFKLMQRSPSATQAREFHQTPSYARGIFSKQK